MALITITVAGAPAAGKTTIATMIQEMLEGKRLPTHLEPDTGNRITSAGMVERLDAIADRFKREGNFIQIIELPVRRAYDVRDQYPPRAQPKLPMWYVRAETEDGEDLSAFVRAVDKSQARRFWDGHFGKDFEVAPMWIGLVPDDNEPGVIDWQRINPTSKASG